MLSTIAAILSLFASIFGTPDRAEILPAFDVAKCSWRATHIVIADEGDVIDGRLRIVRSLKGNLVIGSDLSLPELKAFQTQEKRRYRKFLRDDPQRILDGRKLLLYLMHTPGGWKGAGWGDDVLVSFVWLEADGPFARLQVINPGPLVPTALLKSTAELIAETTHIMTDSRSTDVALHIDDEPLRAIALQQVLLTCNHWHRSRLASLLLQKCGTDGRAFVKAILADERHLDLHPVVMHAYVQSDPRGAIPILHDLLGKELAFWNREKVAPARFKTTAPRDGFFAQHYRRTHTVISGLKLCGFKKDTGRIAKLFEFWTDNPQTDIWLRHTAGRRVSDLIRQFRK